MPGTIQIEPNGIYDDAALRLILDVTSATLARARREGHLRYSRRGKRIFYIGEWVMAWLIDESSP